MKKGTLLHDTLERLEELGRSTAKQTTQAVKETFDPLKMAENALGLHQQASPEQEMKKQLEKTQKKNNNTPLDFDKLQKSYQNQDKLKTDVLRNKLFQMVKSGDEKVALEKQQKKQEQEQQILIAREQKRKKEEEQRRVQQTSAVPQGKEHKSILAPRKKKAAVANLAETKPSTGKQ